MLTLQDYSEKVNKLLIFCFPIFVLFCMFFVSQMPVTTELKSPPPKMEKRLIYELKLTRVRVKVIHTKYSKHHPSTVAHTFECVCSKINHGLNHGLFISVLKLIICPIH